jgi:hypothetical protein
METEPHEGDATPTDDPSPVVEEHREKPPAPFDTPDDEHPPVEEKGREDA